MKRLYKKRNKLVYVNLSEGDYRKLKYIATHFKVSVNFYVYTLITKELARKKHTPPLLEYRYIMPTLKELLDDSK